MEILKKKIMIMKVTVMIIKVLLYSDCNILHMMMKVRNTRMNPKKKKFSEGEERRGRRRGTN